MKIEIEQIAGKPKKIFYIWNYLEWGGAQVYFFGLMKAMQNCCEVKALMPANSNAQLLKFLNNLNVQYEFFDCVTDAQPAPTLKRKLQRHWNKICCECVMLRFLSKFDLKDCIVHIDIAPWQSAFVLMWLAFKTQVFVTVHNSIAPYPKHRYLIWQLKFRLLSLFKNFHIFTANRDAKESLKPLLSKDRFDKIKVTSANINPAEIEEALQLKIDKIEVCKKYNLPPEKFLVFCVGQFIDRKGRWVFLEAAKKLKVIYKDIAFVWISNSQASLEDLQKAASFGLGEDFKFITSEQVGKEHIDLFKLLRIADIFTLPSFLEGLPISLLEAMALRIPSISTDINGIPEAIKHLETGFLLEKPDSEMLKNAILFLKENNTLREKLAKNGREFVLQNFSEARVAKIAVDAYFEPFIKENGE